jgi:hypothetical protein
MSIINEKVPKQLPVECNFWWEPGTPLNFVVGTSKYPYVHQEDEVSRPSDARYKVYTNTINTAITFDAKDSESLGHPKVVSPPGVEIIEYFWNFGDGVTGRGPVISHTYKIAGSETAVILAVTDSRGKRYTCRKPINLIFAFEGDISVGKIRV